LGEGQKQWLMINCVGGDQNFIGQFITFTFGREGNFELMTDGIKDAFKSCLLFGRKEIVVSGNAILKTKVSVHAVPPFHDEVGIVTGNLRGPTPASRVAAENFYTSPGCIAPASLERRQGALCL
jgi:hypothetical protein